MSFLGPRRLPIRRRSRRHRRAARPQPTGLGSERLEPRLALAADLTVSLADGVLRVEGTDGDDAILVHQSGAAVAVDYSSGNNLIGRLTFPSGVESIHVFGGDGRDLIVLHVGSLAGSTVVDTGPDADLVFAKLPVQVRNASGRDLVVPLLDSSLPAGMATTIRRTERPNLAHEATYVGQSLGASRTWTADGRFFEIGFDAQGNTVRDTYLGDRLVLAESWDSTGGYQRTVTDVDGTRLRETFENGTLRIEEREVAGQSSTTLWGTGGEAVRHSTADGKFLAEEVWDGSGGYRRTWVDDAGRIVKEVFENGTPGIKTISNGRRVERGGLDAAGNRVREVLVEGVLVRLDQWDNSGSRRITRFEAGSPVTRETFAGERLGQLEEWTAGRLVRTAWNEAGDRIVQTLVGETKLSEEEIRGSGERRLTEWAGGETIRTMTDAAGNVSVERFAGERLLTRELRSVDGSLMRTTFDSVTGEPTIEERALPGGRQVQRTTFSAAEVLRLTSQDGRFVLRERWRDGGLRRISDDGAGTIRVERFSGSDRATLTEGTKVSDTVTTAAGEQLETVWDPNGTRRATGSKDGIIVLEERQVGSVLTKIVYGGDGSRQEEVFESGQRTKLMQLSGDGSYREQRFTSAGTRTYELVRDPLGSFQETTWSRSGHYNADEMVTVVVADGPGTIGSRNNRMRTVSAPGYQTRQLWRGSGSIPDSGTTYLEQSDYTENAWGWPLGPSDTKQEIYFFDAGRLVYHQRTKGNGSTEVPTNRPSAAWEQAKQGSFFGLSGGNVFSLVPGGASFNLGGAVGYLEDRRRALSSSRDRFAGAVQTVFEPLERAMGNTVAVFTGNRSIGQALDVNFRTIQGDLGKLLGSIDFGQLALPNLDVRFDRIDFGKVFDVSWQPPDVKFTNPFASVDFSPLSEPGLWWNLAFDVLSGNPISNGMKWLGDRFMTAVDWLADRDPFTWIARQVGVDWGPSGERKVVLVAPGERFLEAGYTRDQAALLHDLMDRTPPGLRGRYLDEFNAFLAEEGQRVYQAHLLADGPELDSAGHAGLQQAASVAAQARLLARYGLNPDGSRIPAGSANPGLGLGDIPLPPVYVPDERDPRFNTGADSTWWDFGETTIQPSAPQEKDRKKPKQEDDSEAERRREEEERARRAEEEARKRARVEATRRKVREEFPAAVQKSAAEIRDRYAQGKGKQVKDFHDSVEQTLRIGGAFAAGLGAGATAAVEGLAKTVVAALDADTWRGLASTVRTQGRNFMKADDKAKFIADFGQQAYTSLENAVVATVDEWEKASPEGRARMLGALAGQVATEAVLPGMMAKAAGGFIPLPGHPPIVFGRKTQEAVDKITGSKEFPAYEKKVKDAAGPNKKDLNSLLEGHRKSTGQTLAEQLRRQSGMDPEHARRLSEYARKNKLMIVVRSTNPNSLQYHGKKGFSAKRADLSLKTNPKTGLVTATRRRDGALVDALGEVVKDRKVDAQGWIVNTEKLVNGKPMRTNYRLNSAGHVVDAKGTKFFGDYDLLTVDQAPASGTGWLGVPTGTKGTGSRTIVEEMNVAIVGNDRSRDMFKHGANRENLVKDDKGIYQVDTPDIGGTFTVIDPDGTIFIGDRLYVKRLLEGRNISTQYVLPPQPGDPIPDDF